MNIKILVEVTENNAETMLDHLQKHPQIEKAEIAEANSILNPKLLQGIEDYENGKVKPTPINLADLKELMNAQH